MVVFDPATGRGRLAQDLVDAVPRRARRSSTPSTRAASPQPSSTRSRTGRRSGTNALIERTGCKVAFVTTKGFEDTPFIQRINRKVLYDLRWRKPEPLVASRTSVPRARRAARRRGHRGQARRRGRGAGARAARSATPGAEAVALCLLFSYVSTEHEERVKRDPRRGAAGRARSRSRSEVAPIWREYERSSTTIADAYLRPLFGRYVGSLDARASRRRHDAATGR